MNLYRDNKVLLIIRADNFGFSHSSASVSWYLEELQHREGPPRRGLYGIAQHVGILSGCAAALSVREDLCACAKAHELGRSRACLHTAGRLGSARCASSALPRARTEAQEEAPR